jgi:hypothetical protein
MGEALQRWFLFHKVKTWNVEDWTYLSEKDFEKIVLILGVLKRVNSDDPDWNRSYRLFCQEWSRRKESLGA